MGYAPLFDSLTTGTLCGKWPDIGLWPILLSMKDRHGVIRAAPEYISAVTGLALPEVIACLGRFCEPDPTSTGKDHDGRRLLPDELERNVWHVVNHTKYREKARLLVQNERQVADGRNAAKVRRYKDRKKPQDTRGHPPTPGDTPSYTDTDTDKKDLLRKSVELKLDSGAVDRVFEHWKQTWNHPKAKLDPKRRRVVSVALKGYSEADLCTAITGYQNSAHHRGDNERQTVYDDIGLLLRDAAHIDAGLAFAANHTRHRANGLDLILRTEQEYRAYQAALQQGLRFSDQAQWDSYHANAAH